MPHTRERPAPEPRRQQPQHLLRAGLHVLGDVDDIALPRLRLARDARQPAVAQLQLRDADHVLHAHAHGEVARKLAHEFAVRARLACNALDARKVALRVGLVLVVGEARDAFAQHGVGFGGKACPLSPLFRGERVRVRGRSLRGRSWLPLTPTLSP